MTQAERRRLRETWAVGLAVTVVMVGASAAGWLDGLEGAWYDARARWFQFFPGGEADAGGASAGPVVVHINDAALREVGRWPWPRGHLARVVEQLDAAGAKVVGLDLLLSERQQPRFAVTADGEPGGRIDDDAELAAAMAQARAAMAPVNLPLQRRGDAGEVAGLREAIAAVLGDDLTLRSAAARDRVGERGAGVSDDAWEAAFVDARQRAMRAAVHQAIADGAADWLQAFARVLGGEDIATDSVLRRLLEQEWRRAMAERAMWRFGKVVEGQVGELPEAVEMQPPIQALGEVAVGTGFVDWSGEGVVRSVPLWVEHEGRTYPQFGLATAMQTLGVGVEDVRLERGRVVLPAGGERGDVVIPTHEREMGGAVTAHHMVVPWLGPAERWELGLDVPGHREARGHISLLAVWELVEAERRLRENNAEADRAIDWVLSVMDPSALEAWRAEQVAAGDWPRRREMIAGLLGDQSVADMIDFARELREDGEELDEATAGLVAGYEALGRLREANDGVAAVRAERRQWLRERVAGRPVLIGWTATGAVADFVETPLHTRCPGVVVHATVAQSVLAERFWREGPRWWGWLAMVLAGLAVTAVVAGLSPTWATLGAVAIGGAVAAVDGLVVFDAMGLTVASAGALATTAAAWAGCVGWRYVSERMERTRITRRFSSYVDPALVRYVIDHPEQSQLSGEVRELTVAFTDLAGFTTLSERLGGQTVELLNEYMGLMVPLIREHGGFVNKFLGDGIMFFYGAPVARADHAASAVATVLAMQRAMEQFNVGLAERGLGPVGMRAGVATGSMVVGDAGPPDASDYTVLGDTVNLAARLESANKATGTSAMITQRTVELMDERYAVRPIGRLQVVGKREGVAVYEPMGLAAELDAATRRVIDQTREMVEAYQAGRFDACLAAAEALEADAESKKLVGLYRKACRAEMEHGSGEDFAGQIVLTEK